ncbi:MAG TPA: superoxide dismutase family protein [Mycobacteriales bacterium]|jgi:Cu-Zn family superoxide dismutase
MKRWMALGTATVVAGACLLVADEASARSQQVRALLRDPGGAVVGVVTFSKAGRGTRVLAAMQPNRYVAAGEFHGFHVHANDNPANGTGCVADPAAAPSTWFVSADGHLAGPDQTHGHHIGDMPSPLVAGDGTAILMFTTDRFTPAGVVGRAVVLHAGPDNFGNVPMGSAADQYTANSPAAVVKTQATGNSGDRVACGVVHAS